MICANNGDSEVLTLATESELRLHRCCFTGHRPEKLSQPDRVIIAALEREIRAAADDGFVTFISGMARGVDIWAAEIVLKLRAEGQPVHLVCAVPFEGFADSWEDDWKQRYGSILRKADAIEYICRNYSNRAFQMRNKWMVDNCARVIAVYNGEKGGTKNTIDYAKRCGVEIIQA